MVLRRDRPGACHFPGPMSPGPMSPGPMSRRLRGIDNILSILGLQAPIR